MNYYFIFKFELIYVIESRKNIEYTSTQNQN